jgi:hypothetical protein
LGHNSIIGQHSKLLIISFALMSVTFFDRCFTSMQGKVKGERYNQKKALAKVGVGLGPIYSNALDQRACWT